MYYSQLNQTKFVTRVSTNNSQILVAISFSFFFNTFAPDQSIFLIIKIGDYAYYKANMSVYEHFNVRKLTNSL